jgi:Uma2 family endonuclease
MSTAVSLLTAVEYARLPDPGCPTELVQGEVVELNLPVSRHGQICSRIDRLIGGDVEEHALGHVMANDAGILTERDPDTVRGADVCYISYEKLPPGPLPDRDLDVPPDSVFEVLSPTDLRATNLKKVSEYLEMGVPVVCVVDPEAQSVNLYFPDRPEATLTAEEELTFPQQLPGFRVPVKCLFE